MVRVVPAWRFLDDDRGAITIDWVALTSGILLLGIAVVYAIFSNGVSSVVGRTNGVLGAVMIIDPGEAPSFVSTLADGAEDALEALFNFLTAPVQNVADDGSGAAIISHDAGMALAAGTLSIRFTMADDISGSQTLFSKDSTGYADGGHLTVRLDDGDLWVRLQEKTDSGGQDHFIQLDDAVTAGSTNDLSFSFGPDGMQAYLNGNPAGSNAYTGGISTNGEPVVIGASQWGSSYGQADNLTDPFKGSIESVELYDQQLDGSAAL